MNIIISDVDRPLIIKVASIQQARMQVYFIDNDDLSTILIVGDSLTSDIKGGNNAGIDTCWYNKWKAENTKGVDVTYEIAELKENNSIIKFT